MLTFADGAWHVIANLVIFLAGLWIALGQKRLFGVPQKRAVVLYLWHSFFCMFYFWYSLNNISDSTNYYLYSLSYDDGFKFGTAGVYYLVSPFTQIFNLSYGGVFLLFNIAGYIGMLALASALQSVTETSSRKVKRLSVLILFLPGLSFWSSSISKDALTFMGAGLATWAALSIRRRVPAFAISVLLFLLVRPHMSGILLLSFTLAMLLSSKMGLYKKAALLAISVPLSIVAVQFGLSYAGLDDATNANKVAEYFETRQSHNLEGGSSVDIASMSIPLRMLTYLFRPLLFDAGGLLGLAVSIENLILIFVTVKVAFRFKRTHSVLDGFEFTLFIIFVAVSWFILANSTANLGIAIRQKTMFLPMLMVLLFSYWHKLPVRRHE